MNKVTSKGKQHGVLTIEFALGAMVLFLTTFAIFEMSRFVYIVNLTETALSESARDTRVFEGERMGQGYDERLAEMFNHDGEMWHSLVDIERYRLNRTFYDSLADLAAGNASASCNDRCPIVEVELSYDYQPVYYIGVVGNRTISRRLLSIQEHEGWGYGP
ncbi:TadE family protein [Ferrimonas futtsuensis]|uniref:TadE family protein n=1 Tax=Ferrimonas futtsuensis TaxID=364764 RepID=UPI0004266D99|nr:TadE family protein [Ferrimonas futtsuensis]